MKVIKIEKALLAFAFFAVANDTGTNFDELEADVKDNGGTVEKVADDLVVIKVGGADYTLPLNFAVVINGGIGKVVSKEVFETEYAGVIDEDGFDLDGFIERVAKLETGFNDLLALGGRLTAVETNLTKLASVTGSVAKADGKSKTDKGADKEQDNG